VFSGIEAQTWATHKLTRNNYNNKAWNGTAPVQEYAWLKMASNPPADEPEEVAAKCCASEFVC
jgi:hypothetical protein